MTTIAWRDDLMAADSQSEMGGIKSRNETKLHRVRDALIGISGEAFSGDLFLQWYSDGAKPLRLTELPDIDKEDEFDALVLTRKGVFVAGRYFNLIRVNDPFIAIGSGAMAAMAAMYCGKNAIQAVQIASRCDTDTGGTVRHMRLEDTKCRK